MATGADERSVFASYIEDLSAPTEATSPEVWRQREFGSIPRGPLLQPIVPPTDPQSPPIEKLLDWLTNHWTEATINTRNIRIYGPNCVRDRSSATNLVEILAERGWLAPIKTPRRNMKHWKIARGPSE